MSTADTGPIWTRPEPAGRKPRFTRDQIAAAALRVADTDGFDAVTMKRIAAELGSGTMTLYYYVRNKADVVALMQDAILADLLVPDAELRAGWRAATATIARRTRTVLIAHPWAALSLTDAAFGPNAMRHMEQNLTTLAATELGITEKFALIAAVDAYVLGTALQAIELASRADSTTESVAAAIQFGEALLETGEFPELDAAYREQRDATAPPMTDPALREQFEQGLAALLDGFAARLSLS
ncbi:TetR/AcrR family transcriptional regulator [Nocardia panacis]|uniref:TetR/AcrR family transcriptional regulator n=1 Tax=Nocardia panacis TaxID=2340916 RepID=A0A3A4JZB7_9NOCA|nr:TetR/AcrR family transcriptional regulator [Nocardia panacis]RJO69956.1 TetR/AcrR family transcriptional regulator [Nocardia panacis]